MTPVDELALPLDESGGAVVRLTLIPGPPPKWQLVWRDLVDTLDPGKWELVDFQPAGERFAAGLSAGASPRQKTVSWRS